MFYSFIIIGVKQRNLERIISFLLYIKVITTVLYIRGISYANIKTTLKA